MDRIALIVLGAAALAASALPQAARAADYYDGGYGGGRPHAFHAEEDYRVEGDRFERRRDLRSDGYGRRGPGPVAFDERGEGYRGEGYGERPVAFGRPAYADDRPAYDGRGFGDRHFGERPFAGPYGGGFAAPAFRPAAVYGGGYEGAGFEGRGGVANVSCTIERAQTVTPAGWRKIVTHRTCYRR